MVLATQAQSELRAKLSPIISCTDASPSGGGLAIATNFKSKSLVVPEELPEKASCACCGTGFAGLDPERRLYMCPRRCGERFCSALCVADHSKGIASLEHPFNSYVWDAEEVEAMRSSGDWFETSYSHCCFGGTRVKWTLLFHNSLFLHQALHKPDCLGHSDLESYRVTWTADGQLSFDTAMEAEYPCVTYAHALAAHLRSITPEPVGTYPRTLQSLICTQVRGATRGLQDEQHVIRVVSAVCHVLSNMTENEEENHMRWLMRQVGLRGTDVRITVPTEQIQREVVHPYPAFRWLWRTVLSYKWSAEQHINVLKVTAVLTEFRRRLRDVDNINVRFFNIVDSMVTYYAVTKGRSGSKRMNRTLRRIMALNLASKSVMFSLWTLSKWNFADAASRRFER
eukprot:s1018_g17.t1